MAKSLKDVSHGYGKDTPAGESRLVGCNFGRVDPDRIGWDWLDRINYTGNEVAEEEWKNEDGTKASGIAALEYLNILLLGTDERAVGGTSEDFETGLQEGARADACMLLSLNLKKHTARLVSLERSIGVEIEGAPGVRTG